MQVTNTNIRHKRYSTYGWNVKNEDNLTYKNTLMQGEIGILLGYKDPETNEIKDIVTSEDLAWLKQEGADRSFNYILETRIGTKDNQPFFEALVLKFEDFGGVKRVKQLPNVGHLNCLYIDESDGDSAHVWDDLSGKFIPITGGSGSNIQELLQGYVKKEELYSALVGYTLKTELQQSYYNKDETDEKFDVIKNDITSIDKKISALEGTTKFLGAGPDSNKPVKASNGDVYAATDTGKEYIWVDGGWIELGDTTAEQERLSSVETNLVNISATVKDKVSATQLNQAISDSESKVIALAQEYANIAKTNANTYTDNKIIKIKSDLEARISQAETNISTNSNNIIQLRADLTSGLATIGDRFANYVTVESAQEAHNSIVTLIDKTNNKFNNYYDKTTINDKLEPIETNIIALATAIGTKADKSSITSLETRINALEGTTHFSGAGPLSARPTNAKDGDIYVATDTGKEYIWVTSSNGWVELGDTTAEQGRISEVEEDIKTINTSIKSINSTLEGKANISTVAQDIAAAKQEIKNNLESFVATEISKSENNAKLYADNAASTSSNTVKTELQNALNTLGASLTSEITTTNSKFTNYYTKTEVDTLIENNTGGGNFESIEEIFGGNAQVKKQ